MRRYTLSMATLFLAAVGAGALAHQKVVDESQVETYANEVAAGNREAVRTVFALHTDGASAETQDIVLGTLITVNPRMFLQELQRSQKTTGDRYLPGLLGNLGYDYVDRFKAQIHELRARKAALLTVHDTSLLQLRNTCVASLDKQIKNLASASGADGNSGQ